MFTGHPTQPTSPGSWPEYHTHQLRSFAMADTAETFRRGATYYRKSRHWPKQQRDDAIRQANARAAECQAGTLAINASFVQASSFASEATLDGTHTIESLGEESRTSLTDDSNTTTHRQESETSSGEPTVDYRTPVKRASEHSKGSSQSRRKRRNADDSDYEVSQQSELQSSRALRTPAPF